MRGEEAEQVCPEIQLVQVPVARGKADLNTYRTAGSEVVSILARKGRCERASIDEVYLDLTNAAEKMLAEAPPENLEVVNVETLKSHILGLDNERGIDAKENVREWLCRKDADRCDKLLACGTLIVAELRMQVLKETEFTCSAGIAHNKVQHWLNEQCEELSESLRSDLDQNKRIARTLTLHASAYKSGVTDSQKNFPSKSCPLRYETAKMQEDALNLFQAGLREFCGFHNTKPQGSRNNGWRVTGLSVSASKIVEKPSGTSSIMKYFHGQNPSSLSKQSQDEDIQVPSASESWSEMNLSEQQMKLRGEDSNTMCQMPCLDQQKHKQDLGEDQNPSCLSPTQGQDDFQEASFSTSGIDPGTECCSGLINQSEQQRVFPQDECVVSSLNRLEPKRKTGTNSILKFFKKTDPASSCSSNKEEHCENLRDVEALISYPASVSENGRCVEERRERIAWSYNVDEIDPSVIKELPQEIQEEVRASLRPNKRPNIVRRGSSIAQYFLPTRKI